MVGGIIEVTDGDYSGGFFRIDKISYGPKYKTNNLITFKCSSLNGMITNLQFDNRCSRQIGVSLNMHYELIIKELNNFLKQYQKTCKILHVSKINIESFVKEYCNNIK